MKILEHPDARIEIEECGENKRKITVIFKEEQKFRHIARKTCITSYSTDLIQKILDIKNPANLCDEIMRDEDNTYAPSYLHNTLLAHLPPSEFVEKRILDFGCGSGASILNLRKLFPDLNIVGVELEEKLLSIAKSRVEHYKFKNVELLLSPSPNELPINIGMFDYILLSAVYEHLLPEEREPILKKVWSVLKPGGILFMGETPHRYWPMEGHTTRLPLVNYMPPYLALRIARKFSQRVKPEETWENLLRRGIRGGTRGEIINIIRKFGYPVVLKPNQLGFKDYVDLWYATPSYNELGKLKKVLYHFCKTFYFTFRIIFTPSIFLAIEKKQ